MYHWAYSTWAYVELTLWKCGIVHWWLYNHSKLHLPVIGVTHASQKWTCVHTTSGTMALTPRIPRTPNTNCLWQVTAYARSRKRPTDTVSSIHCQEELEMPYLEYQLQLGWKEHRQSEQLYCTSLFHHKFLCYNKCASLTTKLLDVIYVRQWKSWKNHTWSDVKLKLSMNICATMYSSIAYRASK